MIRRTLKLVITFHTTTAAMAMEQACREENVNGRLIPVPGSISAGCGLAWCADVNCEVELTCLMRNLDIQYQDLHRCLV